MTDVVLLWGRLPFDVRRQRWVEFRASNWLCTNEIGNGDLEKQKSLSVNAGLWWSRFTPGCATMNAALASNSNSWDRIEFCSHTMSISSNCSELCTALLSHWCRPIRPPIRFGTVHCISGKIRQAFILINSFLFFQCLIKTNSHHHHDSYDDVEQLVIDSNFQNVCSYSHCFILKCVQIFCNTLQRNRFTLGGGVVC